MTTKIEWVQNTDGTQGKTWNPITGCSKISEGCTNCFAERIAKRFAGRGRYPAAPHHFDVTLHRDLFEAPLKWKKPTTVFVCSMSDLFHDDVPNKVLHELLDVMINTRQHTYQILTKRSKRLAEFWRERAEIHQWGTYDWYPSNIWLGVTVENADNLYRIDDLLSIQAAVRFASLEPLLANIDISPYLHRDYLHCGIDWCIIGAESGSSRRPMKEEWARRIISQCQQTNTPIFYKQAYENGKKISLPQMDGQQHIQFPQIIDRQNDS